MTRHDYSKEQVQFLVDNSCKYTRKKLFELFNKTFNTNLSYDTLYGKIQRLKKDNPTVKELGKKDIFCVEPERVEWLKSVISVMKWKDIHKQYNLKFKDTITLKALNRKASNIGIVKYPRNHFNDEQCEWLKENIYRYTYPELTRLFNLRFGTKCTQGAISNKCLMFLGIRRGKNRFAYNSSPVGDVRLRKYDGVLRIKVFSSGGRSAWVPLQKVIYEENTGVPVKDDEVIVFIDGNKKNINMNNLVCVKKKIANILNLNSWVGIDKEITLTGIRWCELMYALKEVENSEIY